MNEFYPIIVLLLLLAIAFVLFPILLKRDNLQPQRRGANVALFNQRRGELSAELDRGVIDAGQFTEMEQELQRRLLEDTRGDVPADGAAPMAKPSRAILLGIALCIPLLSYLSYQQLGSKPDWDIKEALTELRQSTAAGQNTELVVERLLLQLNQRISERPEHGDYLATLASLQMERQQYPEAAAAYRRLVELFPADAIVLGRYAQALYLASGRQLNTQIETLVQRALAIDPNQAAILGMMGIASFESADFAQAVDYWSRLLAVMPIGSPNRELIVNGVEQAKIRLLASGVVVAEVVADVAPAPPEPSAAGGIEVTVTIDPSLAVAPGTGIFVFARAVSGPPMPLAVARLTVAQLPATVRLDDSMAMTPALTLSSFDRVNVVARVSLKGSALASSGDFEGSTGPIDTTAERVSVAVVIDRQLP